MNQYKYGAHVPGGGVAGLISVALNLGMMSVVVRLSEYERRHKMSIIHLNNGQYALCDNLVGIIAQGTLKEMEALLRAILKCGTELRCPEAIC